MKLFTSILFVVFFCVSFKAQSQFTKGDKLLGGSAAINFNSSKSQSQNSSLNIGHSFNLGVSPRFSWVTKENQMMGVAIGASGYYSKSFNEGSTAVNSNNSIGLSAAYFIRYYKNFSPDAGWFIECNISGGYNRGTNKYMDQGIENKNKFKGYSAGILIYPGFYYRLSARTLIEASVGGLYGIYNKIENETSSSKFFNIGASFPTSLTLSIQFLLNKKQISR